MSHVLPCHSVHAYAVFVIGIVCVLNGGGLSRADADDGRASDVVVWRVGKDFQHQLQLPSSISWSDQSLRRGLRSLSRRRQIAIWLDRRIDSQSSGRPQYRPRWRFQ